MSIWVFPINFENKILNGLSDIEKEKWVPIFEMMKCLLTESLLERFCTRVLVMDIFLKDGYIPLSLPLVMGKFLDQMKVYRNTTTPLILVRLSITRREC